MVALYSQSSPTLVTVVALLTHSRPNMPSPSAFKKGVTTTSTATTIQWFVPPPPATLTHTHTTHTTSAFPVADWFKDPTHVDSYKVGHEVVKQYELYHFPSEIKLSSCPLTPSDCTKQVIARSKEPVIVYSAFGSPYECTRTKHLCTIFLAHSYSTCCTPSRLPHKTEGDKERR